MNRALALIALAAAATLAACSGRDGGDSEPVTKFELASRDGQAPPARSETMPGEIDPPDAKWHDGGALVTYGEPGKVPLVALTCKDGMVSVTRNIGSDNGAKALLAFVGYRGILRLKVENDGKSWRGALRSDDPHWVAVTGGPFYVTVAGGGKVISPASSIAADVIRTCKPSADAVIKGAPGEGDKVPVIPGTPTT